MKNYYKILEVNENASPEVIEKAYKVLAKKYHPDVQTKDKLYWAENNFKQISEAYETLSDLESRKKYDLDLGLDANGVDYYSKYTDLYSEKEKLQQELHREKFKNQSNEYINQKENSKSQYIKSYIQKIGTLLYNESKKSQQEKKKDINALIITILIVAILLIICFQIPFVKKFLFPF